MKSPLYTVAVITKYKADFDSWIGRNKKLDTKYIHVYSLDRVIGYRFTSFHKLHGHETISKIDDILNYIATHLIK